MLVNTAQGYISVCRICQGPWTIADVGVFGKAAACIRCDTAQDGSGSGAPRFMKIWDERRRDLGAVEQGGTGSEDQEK